MPCVSFLYRPSLVLSAWLLVCLCVVMAHVPALADSRAESWTAVLAGTELLPRDLLVVEKSAQRLSVYARKSPLEVRRQFSCTTGQAVGNKVLMGDLRTPEGAYFVVDKVRQSLDFMEYGGVGYALNYPNPVDRLNGKTGYGIWIHSRGRPITPTETRGCIAVNLDDMSALEPELTPGMPVLVAQNLRNGTDNEEEARISRLVAEKTRQWNAAWASRSNNFFAFYHPESYSKAQGEAFAAFRANKERLFSSLPWIQILYDEVRVLRGPGYWVSWFGQYYRAPNTTSEGMRRLYWQADAAGELKIVGMEWVPGSFGLESSYLETVTPGVTAFVEQWRKAWEQGNLEAYMACYSPDAVQTPRTGAASIRQHKVNTWVRKKPSRVAFSGVRVMVERVGVSVDMTQDFRDASGYQDKGVKRLLLYPRGDSWIIAREDWSAVTQ